MGHDAPLLDNASAPPLAMGVPAAAGTGYAPPQLVAVAGHHQHQQQPPPMLQPPPPQQAAGNTTTATTTVVYAAAAAPPPTLSSAPAVLRSRREDVGPRVRVRAISKGRRRVVF